ncbi:MAG: ATP-dependent zinc metalloprotease FtsH [Planctomycetia bacterium]|nr:ATP-dependent zinc metalloprotease FtsH [Planctomycetia bacterium]
MTENNNEQENLRQNKVPDSSKKRNEENDSNKVDLPDSVTPNFFRLFFIFAIICLLAWLYLGESRKNMAEIDFNFFRQQLESGNVVSVVLQNNYRLEGEFEVPPWNPALMRQVKLYDNDGSAVPTSPESKDKSADTKHPENVTGTPPAAEKKPPDLLQEKKVLIDGKEVTVPRLPKKFYTILPSPIEAGGDLEKEISAKVKEHFRVKEPVDSMPYLMLLSFIVTIVLFVMIWYQFRRTREQMNGGPMFGFTRSPAKRFQKNDEPVTFNDVAGLESVKKDLAEVVDFLMFPEKFERLGARIPKGILMCGPPGTGKTLLARAVAGEAAVPFFSINASEFIQMFVGVGASRVRDMFDVARSNAPSILFIDEIDAIGRLRGTGIGGGNDEREQTLNQILSEMDGFATNDIVIVIAATNRPDVLDPALLRPGRFDRHVTVDSPAQKGRLELFKVHTRKVPLAEDVNLDLLASMTTGLTGADIRNIINEAALWACRNNKEKVFMADFYYAIDKVLIGAKREEVLSENEKRMTAYHEAGHTLMAWLTPVRERIGKVSIIPRGRALGVTQMIPEEDRVSISQAEIEARIGVSMGGRAAEKIVFNQLTAGAENDLKHVTQLAQKMVTSWGMSPRIGPVSFRLAEEHPFLGKEMSTSSREFSENTAQMIDEEVMKILHEAAQRAEKILTENRGLLDALAQALILQEELDEKQIEEIIGPPMYKKSKNENQVSV